MPFRLNMLRTRDTAIFRAVCRHSPCNLSFHGRRSSSFICSPVQSRQLSMFTWLLLRMLSRNNATVVVVGLPNPRFSLLLWFDSRLRYERHRQLSMRFLWWQSVWTRWEQEILPSSELCAVTRHEIWSFMVGDLHRLYAARFRPDSSQCSLDYF